MAPVLPWLYNPSSCTLLYSDCCTVYSFMCNIISFQFVFSFVLCFHSTGYLIQQRFLSVSACRSPTTHQPHTPLGSLTARCRQLRRTIPTHPSHGQQRSKLWNRSQASSTIFSYLLRFPTPVQEVGPQKIASGIQLMAAMFHASWPITTQPSPQLGPSWQIWYPSMTPLPRTNRP